MTGSSSPTSAASNTSQTVSSPSTPLGMTSTPARRVPSVVGGGPEQSTPLLVGRDGDGIGTTAKRQLPFDRSVFNSKRSRASPVIVIEDDPPELISLLSDDEDADTQLIAMSPVRKKQPPKQSLLKPGPQQRRFAFGDMLKLQDPSKRAGTGTRGHDVLLGVLDTKIVGLQYYHAVFRSGDIVNVVRDKDNPHDKNAFRVDNIDGRQVGHLPRDLAAKLAKYADRGIIQLKGRVVGYPGGFDVACDMEVYTDQSNVLPLTIDFTHDRIQFESREVAAIRQNLGFADRGPIGTSSNVPGQVPGPGISGLSALNGQPPFYANEPLAAIHGPVDIDNPYGLPMELIGQVGEANTRGFSNARYGHTEETLKSLPKASQPTRVGTKMLDYQLQGLGWLLRHEHPHLSKKTPTQFWTWVHGNRFWNRMTNFHTESPQLFSGGCLADDMGLGKTIQLISLMCSDPAVAVKSGLIKADTTPQKYGGLPTLILAPVGLMSNWSGQISTHVDPEHPLRVLVWHGTKKIPNVRFADYDVVITSYGSVTSEYKEIEALEDPENLRPVRRTPKNMRIFEQTWRRVILDEAHIIRNPTTKVALGVLRIDAYSRWALTGTPIMNSLQDLFSLVRFFKISGGLTDRAVFERVITRGFNLKDGESETRLQALMITLCLRRLKSMHSIVNLNLPPLNEYMHTIEWTGPERQVYDAMEREARGVMEQYRDSEEGDGRSKYIFLLEALLRLRQICNHKGLCGERLRSVADITDKQVVEATHDSIMALQLLLQAAIDNEEECPICFETLHDPRITLCKHIFGKDCIEDVIRAGQPCPMCRAKLGSPDQWLVAPMDESKSNDNVVAEGSSSKLEAILRILKKTKEQNDSAPKDETPVKTIVFSQWTSFLDIIQVRLVEAGIGFTRIDGKMSVPERDNAILQLSQDRRVTVMLASLAVSSTGLNLTAASQIIISDLWWNVAQERQAVDRCYRLGQTRPVNVFRLVMQNSIEQRVIAIQDEKVELVERALNDGRKATKSKEARLADIERLLTSTEHRQHHAPAALMNPGDRVRRRQSRQDEEKSRRRRMIRRREAEEEEDDDDDDDLDGFIVRDDEDVEEDSEEDDGAAILATGQNTTSDSSDDSDDDDHDDDDDEGGSSNNTSGSELLKRLTARRHNRRNS
ncbi:SNF2 family N-terminal domain-containing protein [Lipomyces kononenkoae]|uniref:SNF2 family N-terminal domain-containing protein n=1 Tax=Lipomyces kononenkoae TaxID=34357 RepID=A0ACC3T7V0_LIPKO